MLVLGIDTATSRASVGLWADGSIVAEEHTSSRNHAASLLPLLDTVLKASGTKIELIDALAVSAGPGSFSGLRVGLSVAKGIALASGARLLAVSTLEALALTLATRQGTVCALLDAHKEELYMGCFEFRGGEMLRRCEDGVVSVSRALALMPSPCLVIGNAVERYGATLKKELGSQIELLPFPEFGPRGGVVADLAMRRGFAVAEVTTTTLEPFYIRPPEVQVNS